MSRKLRRMLREIYASEQPDRYPEFIYQIQRERNRRKLRYAAPVTALVMIAFIGGYSYVNLHRIDHQPTTEPEQLVEVPETFSETTSTTVSTYTTELTTETVINEIPLFEETVETTGQTTIMEVQTTSTTMTTQTETVRELPAEQISEETAIESQAEPIPETSAETQIETTTETKPSVNVDLTALDALQDAYFDLQYQILEASGKDGERAWQLGEQADRYLTELEERYRDNGNPYYERYKRVREEIYESNYGYPKDVYVNPVAQWWTVQKGYEAFMDELIINLKEILSEEEFQKLQASQQNFLQKQQYIDDGNNFPNSNYGWIREEQVVEYRVLLLMEYFS